MDKILNKIYEGVIFIPPHYEELKIKINTHEKLYGEVTKSGMESIIDYLKNKNLFSDINFLDLGCGNGRAVLHMGYYNEVVNSTGIEIFKSKIKYANKILNEIEDIYLNKDKISLKCMNFFEYDNLHDHNVVLINNAGAQEKKYDIIFNKLKSDTTIFSVFQLPTNTLNFIEKINCQYSWNVDKKSLIHVYKKK